MMEQRVQDRRFTSPSIWISRKHGDIQDLQEYLYLIHLLYSMKSSFKTHLALLTVNLIYGANYSIAKIALPTYIAPFAFILIRVGSAVLFYFLLQFIMGREKIDKKDIPMFALCGLFGVAINQICFFVGLSQTTEINASLLMITTPILVLTLGGLMGKEKVTALKVLGIALGALGAFLILKGRGAIFAFSSDTLKGDFFIFVNAVSYSFYLVVVKRLLRRYKPLTVISYVFLFGLIPVIFFGWEPLRQVDWAHMPAVAYFSVFYVIVCTTFFAYLLSTIALNRASSTLVGIYIYSQPLFAAFISIMMGKQQLNIYNASAAVLIFTGVFMVNDPTGHLNRMISRKTLQE